MGTRYKFLVVVLFIIYASTVISNDCDMQGVDHWHFWQDVSIEDVFEGVVVSRTTENITGIQSVSQTLTNHGPYMDVSISESLFIIRTNEAFQSYEEYETSQQISIATTFNCIGGSTRSLTFMITVIDTNNNDPIFRPDDVYEFTVIPPLPPGFQITNNVNQITVRDIDLTTQRIDFEILDNSNFFIGYDASSTTPKEFLASLTTTTLMRNIPEPIEFIISATDVDLTGDPRRTRNATIRIQSDGSFELPEELVFSQTFYLADYTEENEITLQESITLKQGYHEQVKFTLVSGENSEYFDIVPNGNDVTLLIVKPLPVDILALRQIFIIVRADREFTSGTSATVVVQLPEVVNLRFEKPIYEGFIIDNTLELSNLILSQGYENQIISVDIQSEYASNFDYNIAENQISIIMSPLSNDIINQNTFLNLKVVASTNLRSASTVITLEIVKDDLTTPSFEKPLYIGTYDVVEGLILEEIVLIQGFDDSVQLSLQGVHRDLFQMTPPGPNIKLTVSSIPVELFKEQHILLTIEATKPRTVGATTAISISLPPEILLEFENQNYNGKIIDNVLELDDLVLSQGYETENIIVNIEHEYSSSFNYRIIGNSITLLMTSLEADVIRDNTFLNLLVFASTNRSSASTVVTLEIIKNDKTTPIFQHSLFSGSYDPVEGLKMTEIVISQGYDDTVDVLLDGDHTDYFWLNQTGPNINLELEVSSLPPQLYSEGHIFLTIIATKPRTVGANAAVVITLPSATELEFLQDTNIGTIRENELNIDTIIMSVYADDVELTLTGEYENHFELTRVDSQITLDMIEKLPETTLLENDFIVLSLSASATNAVNARTTIILNIVKEDAFTPVFNEKIYTVDYLTPSSLNVPSIFLTQGYDDTVSFRITGTHSEYFTINPNGNKVELTIQKTIPEELIFKEKVFVFNIIAEKPLTVDARAAISMNFPIELTEPTALAFSKTFYTGSLEQSNLKIENIELSVGFTTSTEFRINGAYKDYFEVQNEGNILTVFQTNNLPSEVLNFEFIALELQAQRERAISVSATIIIDIVQPEPVTPPVFSAPFYRAVYTEEKGLQFETDIVLSQGFDDTVTFELEGVYRDWFYVTNNDDLVLISVKEIPADVLESNQHLVFSIDAIKTGAINGIATIVIDLPQDVQEDLVRFDRVLYEGRIQGGIVQHEIINLSGFEQDKVDIIGSFSTLFSARHNNGVVIVETVGSLTLPADLRHVVLELRADNAAAVLTLEITDSDLPKEPNVIFSSESYVIQVEKGQTGTVGQVEAIADNGESLTYSLHLDNEHLLSRLSITNDGELRLSAPADIGSYNFQAVATTVFTGTNGVTTVYLSVHETTPCVNDVGVPPLVVIDRDEEEPHRDLVTIDTVQHAGCHYRLENNWPTDQQWLYVDETGLHAHAIDREHPSIAFMALSQIKVELTLHCNTETRNKRSTRQNWLGSYDYGINTWLLGNTIEYNRKTTIVNLIVNDINDNAPIFIGKENEPIAVGYPVSDLISTISPRSLIELKATDADIGENAALMYWSSESQLAVSSSTGFVHVRNDAQLTQDMQLIVSATDLNGQGLTGTISLIVKLLDINNIAVLTVQNAFLEDESTILSNISSAVGYDVKALKSVVVSNSEEQAINTHNREKRDVDSNGHSLQIHVYGLMQREPVLVENLSADINENAEVIPVTITRIASLEEHLQESNNFSGRNVGLLVSTIVLSVLLFLVIVAAVVVWFIFLRRKLQNYEQFSETNSLSSKTEPTVSEMKPDTGDTLPRLNIEELKRSERRLQDMLNAPIENIVVEPTTSANNTTIIPINPVDNKAPIIIQDKLKDGESSDEDEFGERKKGRRKSVVTFNENVEKIIHVEDNPEESLKDDDNEKFEIYKL